MSAPSSKGNKRFATVKGKECDYCSNDATIFCMANCQWCKRCYDLPSRICWNCPENTKHFRWEDCPLSAPE